MTLLPILFACALFDAEAFAGPPVAVSADECIDCALLDSTRLPPVIVVESAGDGHARGAENSARIDVLELRRYKPDLDLIDVLTEVPGMVARDRYNLAQDTQINVRGFGARSAFGVRGVRIEYDGIPATAADGQTQIGHIDLAAVGRVEVIRGPFAALHGNGGAFIRIDGGGPRRADADRVSLALGSHGQRRAALALDGGEPIRWDISANRFETDGVRAQSSAQRSLFSARAQIDVGDDALFSVSANRQDQPDSEDPQGLTRAEFALNPRGANPAARLFGTVKSVTQDQVGALYRVDVGASRLEASAYAGERQVNQVLSVSRAAQLAPGNGGGVIELARDYAGGAVRFTHERSLGGVEAQVSAELRIERLVEDRRGFENFLGPQLGVRGALRRDERNRAWVRDTMLRLDLDPNDAWRLSAGVRRNSTDYRSEDHYLAPGNPDDSGRYEDSAWLPVVGVLYRVSERFDLHAAAGRTHELPTLAELAYRADGDGGFNQALRPARARQWELGARYADAGWHLEATAFRVLGESEIVVQSSEGGRTSFQNAGSTMRQGLELAGDYALGESWRLRAVLNLIEARYTSDYLTCLRQPCTAPDFTILSGRRVPGVSPRQGLLEVLWRGGNRWSGALDLRALDATAASDRNDDRVPGYAALNVRLARQFQVGNRLRMNAQFRIDNLLDHTYSASLIVNEGARRYFEPAPGRSFFVGMEMRW